MNEWSSGSTIVHERSWIDSATRWATCHRSWMKADRESIQAVNAFMQNLDVVKNVHLSVIDVLPTNLLLLVAMYWLWNYWSHVTISVILVITYKLCGYLFRWNLNRRMPFDVVNINEKRQAKKNTRKIRSCVSSDKVHEWTEWMNPSEWNNACMKDRFTEDISAICKTGSWITHSRFFITEIQSCQSTKKHKVFWWIMQPQISSNQTHLVFFEP